RRTWYVEKRWRPETGMQSRTVGQIASSADAALLVEAFDLLNDHVRRGPKAGNTSMSCGEFIRRYRNEYWTWKSDSPMRLRDRAAKIGLTERAILTYRARCGGEPWPPVDF